MNSADFTALILNFPIKRQSDYVGKEWTVNCQSSIPKVVLKDDETSADDNIGDNNDLSSNDNDFWSRFRSHLSNHYTPEVVNTIHNDFYTNLSSFIESRNLDDLETIVKLVG